MLKLPVYRMPNSGIYYLHTRFGGKQFKRSLKTTNRQIATLHALELIKAMTYKKFEIDLGQGIFKANGPEDSKLMLEALGVIRSSEFSSQFSNSQTTTGTAKQPLKRDIVVAVSNKKGLSILGLLDKYFLLKSHLVPATALSYKNTVQEFSEVLKKPLVEHILVSDVTWYQEYLAVKGNTPRTIDSKIGTIRALMNFAIKQGFYFEKNPAADRNLQSRREKAKSGFAIFDAEEIELIFNSEFFHFQRTKDPDYFWATLLCLVTGCRSSEVTSLEISNLKTTKSGKNFFWVRDSKTAAGIREVPFPSKLMEIGFQDFIKGKEKQVFKYEIRDGKGSGNAVGKKFARNIESVNINRPKLVFHSLRKFCNDFLLKNKIPIDARCQFIGHEIDSVNVQVYASKLTIDELHDVITPVQDRILELVRFKT